jgi:hypothetical protein
VDHHDRLAVGPLACHEPRHHVLSHGARRLADEPNEAKERRALREPRPTDGTSRPKRRRQS